MARPLQTRGPARPKAGKRKSGTTIIWDLCLAHHWARHPAQGLPRVGTAHISLECMNGWVCRWENEWSILNQYLRDPLFSSRCLFIVPTSLSHRCFNFITSQIATHPAQPHPCKLLRWDSGILAPSLTVRTVLSHLLHLLNLQCRWDSSLMLSLDAHFSPAFPHWPFLFKQRLDSEVKGFLQTERRDWAKHTGSWARSWEQKKKKKTLLSHFSLLLF